MHLTHKKGEIFMTRMKTHLRRKALILLAMTLLVISFLFAACGSNGVGSSSTAGGSSTIGSSPASTQSQGSSATATPGTTSSNLQSINSQMQTAVQGVDNSQNDVNNADATSTTENGSDPQP
jgi:hypothetical protein